MRRDAEEEEREKRESELRRAEKEREWARRAQNRILPPFKALTTTIAQITNKVSLEGLDEKTMQLIEAGLIVPRWSYHAEKPIGKFGEFVGEWCGRVGGWWKDEKVVRFWVVVSKWV